LILLIEAISRNIDIYVPAYPLPIMEIASFIRHNMPKVELGIISLPVDYGLPLTQEGKDQIYRDFLKDLAYFRPKGVGISCTGIAQAEEVIHMCELIKEHDPNIFIFVGGYFPTVYYQEIFERTSAIDLIVIGEGEFSALKIIQIIENGTEPVYDRIPNLVWQKDGQIHKSKKKVRFDLKKKAPLDLKLLRYPRAYDILPYAFSRGCPYRCNFCMEELIRPRRRVVPFGIIQKDLKSLRSQSYTDTLMISDALFNSFDKLPFLQSLGIKLNFETRCDVLDPGLVSRFADVFGIIALGFESASYESLRRMNKVKDRAHYNKYISNTKSIFNEAVENEIPIIVFLIGGYPGDTEEDLEKSLNFVRELSEKKGQGGYIFKIGECRVYPKTKTYDLALSLPDVVFDDDGVFGQNVVRQPSEQLNFETVLIYMKEIFDLSNTTPKLRNTLLKMMPFFRLPAHALRDAMIPDTCFLGSDRSIFNVQAKSLSTFRQLVPKLNEKYREWMSSQRSSRNLPL
jgi:pyruvate-formate lyase-activating enzyme